MDHAIVRACSPDRGSYNVNEHSNAAGTLPRRSCGEIGDPLYIPNTPLCD